MMVKEHFMAVCTSSYVKWYDFMEGKSPYHVLIRRYVVGMQRKWLVLFMR